MIFLTLGDRIFILELARGSFEDENSVPECKKYHSPTLRCILQLRISCPQWAVFNGVKGQTSVIVQSDPSISISGSLLLGER